MAFLCRSTRRLKFHFTLELKRLIRQINALGLHPKAVLLFIGTAFIFLLFYLSRISEQPKFLIILAGVASVYTVFKSKRVSFYRAIYNQKEHLKIQCMESFIMAFPFFLILMVSGVFLEGFIYITVASISPLIIGMAKKRKTSTGIPVIPTPFRKNPFEFIRGFRTSWPLYLLLLFLMYKAVDVNNFNLGLTALLVAMIAMGFFYVQPEPITYATIYIQDAKGFIWQKIKLALRNSLLLSSPIILFLVGFFPNESLYILLALIFGLLFITSSLLGKYAYFPLEMNVIQSFALTLCLLMPPLVLLAIPVFYKKAHANLKPLLS